MKHYLLLFTICCVAGACTQQAPEEPIAAPNSFTADLGQPSASPTPFAEGMVTTGLNERDLALSPTGDTLLFSVQEIRSRQRRSAIYVCYRDAEGAWSAPKLAPFSGEDGDLEPAFSPDGSRLYFVSRRAYDGQPEDEQPNADIYYVTCADGWGTPVRLGAPVNTPANEFYPSVAADGTLYYTAEKEGGIGSEDIWAAEPQGDGYAEPTVLPEPVNSQSFEFNAFIDPAERYIILTSYGRADDLGGADLYYIPRNEDGTWGAAVHLPAPVNGGQLDYCPFVWQGVFFFTSNRQDASGTATDELPADLRSAIKMPFNGLDNVFWMSTQAAGLPQ